jgi:hypothetical protein
MKQYPWKFKLCWDGIDWWQSEKTLGSDHYCYYFKVGLMNKQDRDAYRKVEKNEWWKTIFGTPTIGLHKFWYDHPHAQLNLYWIVFYWSAQWTTMPKDKND